MHIEQDKIHREWSRKPKSIQTLTNQIKHHHYFFQALIEPLIQQHPKNKQEKQIATRWQ